MNFTKHLIIQKVSEDAIHVEYNHTLYCNIFYRNSRNNQHYILHTIYASEDEGCDFTDIRFHTHYDLRVGDILLEDKDFML